MQTRERIGLVRLWRWRQREQTLFLEYLTGDVAASTDSSDVGSRFSSVILLHREKGACLCLLRLSLKILGPDWALRKMNLPVLAQSIS